MNFPKTKAIFRAGLPVLLFPVLPGGDNKRPVNIAGKQVMPDFHEKLVDWLKIALNYPKKMNRKQKDISCRNFLWATLKK